MLAAARLYDRLQSLGYWEQLHCPQPLGFRPSFHPVQEVGSACEAWVQRGAQFVLSRVLSGNMHGLEWSAGSSTRFYLLWLASLHSVEHDAGWAAIVERQIRTELPHAATAAWRFDRVAANASFRGERKAFQAYVNVPLQRAKYDFVSVDGRARGRCLDRVRVDRLRRAVPSIEWAGPAWSSTRPRGRRTQTALCAIGPCPTWPRRCGAAVRSATTTRAWACVIRSC